MSQAWSRGIVMAEDKRVNRLEVGDRVTVPPQRSNGLRRHGVIVAVCWYCLCPLMVRVKLDGDCKKYRVIPWDRVLRSWKAKSVA